MVFIKLIAHLPAFIAILSYCAFTVENRIVNNDPFWLDRKELSAFEKHFIQNFDRIAVPVSRHNSTRSSKALSQKRPPQDFNELAELYSNTAEGDAMVAILEHLYQINKSTNILSWNKTNENEGFKFDNELSSYHDDQSHQSLNDESDIYPDQKFGVVTNYCGPGNWADEDGNIKDNYFSNIDSCCKNHDECDDVITKRSDYQKYPGLEYRSQYFTRLRCNCDVQFFQCLYNISSYFSNSIVWIYSHAQSNCFDYEHPIIKCRNYEYSFWYSSRCIQYEVDNSQPKRWQWFDLPFTSSDDLSLNYKFPKIKYTYPQLGSSVNNIK